MEITETTRELTLLEEIESDPNVNQSTLATQLGVAVGTVNWHLRRLIEKGYVKVARAERKKLRYIITPEGIALRVRLAVDYLEHSFDLYRKTRKRVKEQELAIAYVAEAEVVHVHHETPSGVFNRYRREAMAFKRIHPESHISIYDFLRLTAANILSDF